MLNYWWVTRPKRKLDSIPQVLSMFTNVTLNQKWNGKLNSQLTYEKMLEDSFIKKVGSRKDQSGGGARTYKAWLTSLGLIFTDSCDGSIKLTEAGEALLSQKDNKIILTNQVYKYQFPSSFSTSKGVQVATRFKIHPFQFLIRLLCEPEIRNLTEEEVAKIVVIEAEQDTDECLKKISHRILEFRKDGDACLEKDFFLKYQSSKGGINLKHPYSHLIDLSNSLFNWLEYTGYVNKKNGQISLNSDFRDEINDLISIPLCFIANPEDQVKFQTEYGKMMLR